MKLKSILKIKCAPVTWPIGMGKRFHGIYHLRESWLIYMNREKINVRGNIEID